MLLASPPTRGKEFLILRGGPPPTAPLGVLEKRKPPAPCRFAAERFLGKAPSPQPPKRKSPPAALRPTPKRSFLSAPAPAPAVLKGLFCLPLPLPLPFSWAADAAADAAPAPAAAARTTPTHHPKRNTPRRFQPDPQTFSARPRPAFVNTAAH